MGFQVEGAVGSFYRYADPYSPERFLNPKPNSLSVPHSGLILVASLGINSTQLDISRARAESREIYALARGLQKRHLGAELGLKAFLSAGCGSFRK